MSTIDELMQGKKPGEIKIARAYWDSTSWFAPYFKDRGNYWHGLLQGDHNFVANEALSDWHLYAQPKPKRILYEWIYRDAGSWIVRDTLLDDDEMAEWANDVGVTKYRKTGREFEVVE